MSAPEAVGAYVRDLHKLSLEWSAKFGSQIATWLVIGNAGALTLGFNALLQGTACDHRLIERTMLRFSWGLVLAFAGAVTTYVSMLRGAFMLDGVNGALTDTLIADHYINELKAEGVDERFHGAFEQQKSGAQVRFGKIQKRAAWSIWIGPGVGIALYLASMAAFALGVAGPLASASAFRVCTAGSPVNATPVRSHR